jgi:hypothetical protein
MGPLRNKSGTNGLKKFENMANSYMHDTGGNRKKRDDFDGVTVNKVET